MNYLKVYCNLIRKAENRTPPEGYTEKHHVFPKSIFGKNNRIVVLTAREHYIAHALLEKICIQRYGLKDKRTIKMTYAHMSMSGVNGNNQRYYNSYLYECARVRFSINNPSRRFDVKQKQINSALERWSNPEQKQKMIGENNHFYGRHHSEETKAILREKTRAYMTGTGNPRTRTWKITFDNGDILVVECLKLWVRENGYNYDSVLNVKRKISSNHKGIIKIEHYDETKII
jgi:hypothetical protein